MIVRLLLALAVGAFFVACQPAPSLTPFALSAAPLTSTTHTQARQISTPFPTQTPRPLFASRTPSQTPTVATSTSIPSDTPVPTFPPLVFATSGSNVTPMVSTSIFRTQTPAPSWTPPALDPLARVPEHFLLDWPILNGVYTLNRVYPYGTTNGGRLQVHHGDDLVNPLGTPIHAAGDGTVVYAGNDFTTLFGPYTDYYGNLVVIQHNFLSPEGLPVFTLYGHMDQLIAESGQPVRQGDIIGTVGATGIALGPHVHVEIRIGSPFDFGATRNPELWLRPLANFGLLVGRVTDAAGNLAENVTLSIQSTRSSREAYTYEDTSVNSDPALGENFTLGNLPPDYYAVRVIEDGRLRFDRTIYVYPNQISWISVALSP